MSSAGPELSCPDSCIICLDSLCVPAAVSAFNTWCKTATATDVHVDQAEHSKDSEKSHQQCAPRSSGPSSPSLLCSLESCNHIYHSQCILEWAERSNSCPSCRAPFSKLYVRAPENFELVFEELGVPERKQPVANSNEYNSASSAGLHSETMPMTGASSDADATQINSTTTANSNTTTTTTTTTMVAITGYNEESPYENCVICQSDERSHELLICEGCERTFHITCLGLDCVPFEAWYCPSCEIDYCYTDDSSHDQLMRLLLRSGNMSTGTLMRSASRSGRTTRRHRPRPARTVADLAVSSSALGSATSSALLRSGIHSTGESQSHNIHRTRPLSSRVPSRGSTATLLSLSPSSSSASSPSPPVAPSSPSIPIEEAQAWQVLEQALNHNPPSNTNNTKHPSDPSDLSTDLSAANPDSTVPQIQLSTASTHTLLNNNAVSNSVSNTSSPPKKLKRPSRAAGHVSRRTTSATTPVKNCSPKSPRSTYATPVSAERGESVQSLLSHIRSSAQDPKAIQTPSSVYKDTGEPCSTRPSASPLHMSVGVQGGGSPRERARESEGLCTPIRVPLGGASRLVAEKNTLADDSRGRELEPKQKICLDRA